MLKLIMSAISAMGSAKHVWLHSATPHSYFRRSETFFKYERRTISREKCISTTKQNYLQHNNYRYNVAIIGHNINVKNKDLIVSFDMECPYPLTSRVMKVRAEDDNLLK